MKMPMFGRCSQGRDVQTDPTVFFLVTTQKGESGSSRPMRKALHQQSKRKLLFGKEEVNDAKAREKTEIRKGHTDWQ